MLRFLGAILHVRMGYLLVKNDDLEPYRYVLNGTAYALEQELPITAAHNQRYHHEVGM
jgi:hypothetical protein